MLNRGRQMFGRLGATLAVVAVCLAAATGQAADAPSHDPVSADYRLQLASAELGLVKSSSRGSLERDGFSGLVDPVRFPDQSTLYALLALMALGLGGLYWWRSRRLQAELASQRLAELAMRESEQAYRALVEAAPFPVVISCARTGRIRFLNSRSEEHFGIRREEVIGLPLAQFCQDGVTRDRLAAYLKEHGKLSEVELRLHDAQGQPFWGLVSASVVQFEGQPGVFVAFNDITERKQLEARLEHMVNTDALTNLASRRRILEILEQEHGRASRYGSPLAILAVDIDHFKQINDNHGHDAGDEALRAFASVLRSGLRSHDSAGRMGGEEFMVVLPETGPDEALQVAERLRAMVAELAVCVDKKVIRLTTSIGIASLDSCATVEELIKAADHALYAAKDAGRNRVVFHACKLH